MMIIWNQILIWQVIQKLVTITELEMISSEFGVILMGKISPRMELLR